MLAIGSKILAQLDPALKNDVIELIVDGRPKKNGVAHRPGGIDIIFKAQAGREKINKLINEIQRLAQEHNIPHDIRPKELGDDEGPDGVLKDTIVGPRPAPPQLRGREPIPEPEYAAPEPWGNRGAYAAEEYAHSGAAACLTLSLT